jgi:hypothetical protein
MNNVHCQQVCKEINFRKYAESATHSTKHVKYACSFCGVVCLPALVHLVMDAVRTTPVLQDQWSCSVDHYQAADL